MTPRFRSFTALATEARLVSRSLARPMNTLLPSFPQSFWLLSSDHGDCSTSAEDLADFADFGVSAQSLVATTRFKGLCFVREAISACVGVSGSAARLPIRSKSPNGSVVVRADTGLARGLTSPPLALGCEPRHVGGDFAKDPRMCGCGEETRWLCVPMLPPDGGEQDRRRASGAVRTAILAALT